MLCILPRYRWVVDGCARHVKMHDRASERQNHFAVCVHGGAVRDKKCDSHSLPPTSQRATKHTTSIQLHPLSTPARAPFHRKPPTTAHNEKPATMSLTNCRFYEEKFPEIDSFVMVNVKQIAEMGAYVKLLEYDNIDGMILLSELSRRRIRSIQKLIRVGRNEVVVVLRVDKDKGYIDLSKRRVSPEDIVKCEERYNKGKMVHSIMRHVAEKINVPIEELYQDIGWPLNKKYGHAVDAFKLSITNPDVWNEVTFKSSAIKDELVSYIGKRLTPQPTKVRADIEVRHTLRPITSTSMAAAAAAKDP